MNDFSTINEVYASYFSTHFPARSCIAVKSLPKQAKIEIEFTAYINKEINSNILPKF